MWRAHYRTLFCLAWLSGCGVSDVAMPVASRKVGHLVGGTGEAPGPIRGVYFRTPTEHGTTDEDGAFYFREGETIIFSVANVDLRPSIAREILSPWNLASDGGCRSSDELDRVLQLLYSLDGDGDAANGTALPGIAPSTRQRELAGLSGADLAIAVASIIPGREVLDVVSVREQFIAGVDGEAWEEIGIDTFPFAVGLVRSQGVTSDGQSWFFSWKLGLERTDLDYAVEASASTAIPSGLQELGVNHIGDIDLWDGVLYAPVEDGAKFKHPHIVRYDPITLEALDAVPLPTDVLTQGVPWIGVDGPRQALYASQWDPVTEIFEFDLATLSLRRRISLTSKVGRIQGGKVLDGSLYLSSDDAEKTIFKVDPDTGVVLPVFRLLQKFEQEGLVFLSRPDGSLLHTLNVMNPPRGTEFRHFRRTREPLRRLLCFPVGGDGEEAAVDMTHRSDG